MVVEDKRRALLRVARIQAASRSFFRDDHRLSGRPPTTLNAARPLPITPMSSNARPVVFMDVNIGETPAGRMKMELFSDIVPKYVHATTGL